MTNGDDWLAVALGTYRSAFQALSRLPEPPTIRAEYLVDELREALLDLKEAVIAEDQEFAERAMAEVLYLNDQLEREMLG